MGSERVAREVHLAGAERTPVVPVVLATTELPDDLAHYLDLRAPIDLRPDRAEGLRRLVDEVNAVPRKRVARPRRAIALAVVLAVLVAAAWVGPACCWAELRHDRRLSGLVQPTSRSPTSASPPRPATATASTASTWSLSVAGAREGARRPAAVARPAGRPRGRRPAVGWLGVRTTEAQLLADIAEGYDVLIMGADKWHQVLDVRYYGGSGEARDAAVARLPRLAIAPDRHWRCRPSSSSRSRTATRTMSSSRARAGARELMVPEAADFDRRTGAWTDPARYERWLEEAGRALDD